MEEEKRDKGRPKKFETAEEFEECFLAYMEKCKIEKRFPNIAGFCAHCRMSRDTYYAQKDYYSDTYNIIDCILEDAILQENSYRAQLYLKNKFGYADKVEGKVTKSIDDVIGDD